MNVAVFGSFGQRILASGWSRETAIALLGGGDFDLTGVVPGDNARLTAVAIFGSIDVIVDERTPVTMSGFSLFGSRVVKVAPGDGPEMPVRAFAFVGSVEVRPPETAEVGG